jgi:AcrR family transcriptional regulator
MTVDSREAVRAARRQDMAGSSDARAMRTRKILVAAVGEALEKDPDRPTVAAICSIGGVTRSTFYSHFSSVDDLVVKAVSDAIESISAADASRRMEGGTVPLESTRIVLREIAEQLRAQPALFGWALSRAGAETSRRISDNVAAQTRRTIHAIATVPDDVDVDLTAQFLAGGVLNVIRASLLSPGRSFDDRGVEHLLLLIPDWIWGPRQQLT